MTGKNASYNKGWRFENATRQVLSTMGDCVRTFMSGAYSGACDLVWTFRNRKWGVSCKVKGDGFKSIYRELEKDDTHLFIGRADRKPAIIALYLHDLPEFLGEDQP